MFSPAALACASPGLRSSRPPLSSVYATFLDSGPDAVPAAPYPSASDLNIRPLSCSFRHRHGSRSSRRLRNEKALVPGVIYGNVYGDGLSFRTPKISVQTDMVRLYNEMRKFPIKGLVYDLALKDDGSVHRVVPQGLKAGQGRSHRRLGGMVLQLPPLLSRPGATRAARVRERGR